VIYVYAIVSTPVEAHLQGIGGARVVWVASNGLAAAVSEVPAGDFEEEPLNANIRDMAWLGPRAVAHQEVNARLFQLSDASVPLAFGTVFRDEDGVRQLLATNAQNLSTRLEKVRNCAEWVVALHLLRAPDADVSPVVQQLRGEIAASSPGRAHLLQQRLQTLERDESRRLQAEAATELFEALRAIAVDVFRELLPADIDEKPLLRASVLVHRDTDFPEEVERMRERWAEPTYRLVLTGPWPPYRFGGL
jgi:gas vesicle protein GvpL/GvpF